MPGSKPQARWRAAWIVDAKRDGKTIPLFVKGSREVHALTPVKLEGAALDVFHKNGIKAPKQYGHCPEIDAIVMERLEGESRLENITDVAVRDKVADEYVQAMVQFHALDPQLFVDAGFKWPADPAQLRLAQFLTIEKMYLGQKRVARGGQRVPAPMGFTATCRRARSSPASSAATASR